MKLNLVAVILAAGVAAGVVTGHLDADALLALVALLVPVTKPAA